MGAVLGIMRMLPGRTVLLHSLLFLRLLLVVLGAFTVANRLLKPTRLRSQLACPPAEVLAFVY
jgi:hypothetical protein